MNPSAAVEGGVRHSGRVQLVTVFNITRGQRANTVSQVLLITVQAYLYDPKRASSEFFPFECISIYPILLFITRYL